MARRIRKGGAVRSIALVGMCAAVIECAKLSLAALPNVEVVTLLCALFGYTFGPLGMLSVYVFVSIEPLIWGVNTWVISYYIHWPLIALVFWLLARVGVRNRWVLTGVAVGLTFGFGVLTSLVDVGLFTGFYDRFFYRFWIYYCRGTVFYIVQIVCNAAVFPLLFPPMSRLLAGVGRRFGTTRWVTGTGRRRRRAGTEETISVPPEGTEQP